MVRFKVRVSAKFWSSCLACLKHVTELLDMSVQQNRYLLVEFIFDEDAQNGKPNVTEGLLHSIIRDSLAANFGEVGWGQVGTSLTSASCRTEIQACNSSSTADMTMTFPPLSQILVSDYWPCYH